MARRYAADQKGAGRITGDESRPAIEAGIAGLDQGVAETAPTPQTAGANDVLGRIYRLAPGAAGDRNATRSDRAPSKPPRS